METIEEISRQPIGSRVGPLRLNPVYREYVWGGQRLRPGRRTAEAWVVYEGNSIADGPWAGRTLAEAAAQSPLELLGEGAMARTGTRFPLLIKLLDSVQWLSVQVHPDDELAEKLEGPGQFGKTEAWHVLEAEPDAQIIAGLHPETTSEELATAIRNGTILGLLAYREVRAGDTILMPARTVHAVGPGLLIYEVQQTSDLTYRVFDWNRPPTPGRELHIDRSLVVADAASSPVIDSKPAPAHGGPAVLASCAYFTLELLTGRADLISSDSGGLTFHALTVIEGAAGVITQTNEGGGVRQVLGQFDSVVIPAACGPYVIEPIDGCRILRASIG